MALKLLSHHLITFIYTQKNKKKILAYLLTKIIHFTCVGRNYVKSLVHYIAHRDFSPTCQKEAWALRG